jgi:stage V sporulation protein R
MRTARRGGLTAELEALSRHIEEIARSSGLDFFDVVFELLDARDVNAVAAYGGFPVRYPSWRFGMEYERLEKGHAWGLSKIYELVINNDPTYAYLVRSNSLMEQKLVMAHVFGHADFFKHNVWFQPTERRMLDVMANHGTRIRRYIDLHGQDVVDRFLDLTLALDTLIDPYQPLRELRREVAVGAAPRQSHRERALRSLERVREEAPAVAQAPAGPGLPTFDVLGFLCEEAPVEPWQRDVLRMLRAEAGYFAPQRMTKIMNEGWASFWHSRILTRGLLGPEEIVDFADCHSGATAAAPGQLNPYKLGIELFRHAEELGLDLFRLRAVHNDASFVDALVDEEFCEQSRLFLFARNPRTSRAEIADRDWRAVKRALLAQLSWGGLPRIALVDRNREGKGGLHLEHRHDGRDLELASAGETLRRIAELWRGPVSLATRVEGKGRLLVVEGEELRVLETSALPEGAEEAAE